MDILRILSDYKKATNIPQIAKSKGSISVGGKTILNVQEYFYKYITEKISDKDKTESIIEYMDYLRKQISSKKKFSSKPEHFALNQIFSIFSKGFDFHFDYENIELVAYDKNNIVSSKIIIPWNEFIFGINFTRIFVKLLDLEIEISDLNKVESILAQLKGLAEDKFKVVQIVLKPCYKQIKDGIDNLIEDKDDEEYKQILKNNNPNNFNNNINQVSNISQNQDVVNINENENEQDMVNINQNDSFLNQKQKENELLNLMIKNHKENELLIKKQKDQTQLNQINKMNPKNQANLRHPLNSTHQQVPYPQKQQKNNLIPKNLNSMNVPINNNINYEESKMPIDSIRQKNKIQNSHLPKMESSNSYQLLGNNQLNLKENILSGNFNTNMDFGDNKLSNTNYNIFVPNMKNEIDYGQQQYIRYNN